MFAGSGPSAWPRLEALPLPQRTQGEHCLTFHRGRALPRLPSSPATRRRAGPAGLLPTARFLSPVNRPPEAGAAIAQHRSLRSSSFPPGLPPKQSSPQPASPAGWRGTRSATATKQEPHRAETGARGRRMPSEAVIALRGQYVKGIADFPAARPLFRWLQRNKADNLVKKANACRERGVSGVWQRARRCAGGGCAVATWKTLPCG